MAAKKITLPAAAKKKALPVMPPKSGRTPAKPVPGRSTYETAKTVKAAAVKKARKTGGK